MKAYKNPLWDSHRIGDQYTMDGDPDLWKIAYYPLTGTYKHDRSHLNKTLHPSDEGNEWIEFKEPRALIEKPIENGIDFREVPLRYLKRKL